MAKDPTKEMTLQEQAEEIVRIAQKHGVEQNFFFLTTFKRYQVQISIMHNLEQSLKEDGHMVTKEYVKGRGNLYTHPAIQDYNRTATASKQPVQTLMKIIQSMRKEDPNKEDDELIAFIRGNRR